MRFDEKVEKVSAQEITNGEKCTNNPLQNGMFEILVKEIKEKYNYEETITDLDALKFTLHNSNEQTQENYEKIIAQTDVNILMN